MNPCAYERQLTAWILGELPEAEAAAVQSHLEGCEHCKSAAGELRVTLALLGDTLTISELESVTEPKLDPSSRAMLLDIQPDQEGGSETPVSSQKGSPHWFFRIHPAFKAAAALVIILSVVIMGAISTVNVKSSMMIASLGSDEVTIRGEVDGVARDAASDSSWFARSQAESPAILEAREATLSRSGAMGGNRSEAEVAWVVTKKNESNESGTQSATHNNIPAEQEFGIAENQLDAPAVQSAIAARERSKAIGRDRQSAVSSEMRRDLAGVPPSGEGRVSGVLKDKKPILAGAAGGGAVIPPAKKPAPAAPVMPMSKPASSAATAKEELFFRQSSLSKPGEIGGEKLDDFSGALPAEVEAEESSQMAELKIELPKPQFTGTPKDLGWVTSGGALRESRSRLVVAADAAVVREERAAADEVLNADAVIVNGAAVLSDVQEKKSAADQKEVIGQLMSLESLNRKSLENHGEAIFKYVDANEAQPEPEPEPPKVVQPVAFNPFVKTAENNFSTFAIDVDTASYTLTRQAIQSGVAPEPERVRTEEIVNAFDYGDTAPEKATFRIYQDGAQSPFGPGLNMLRIGVKGRRLGREEQRPAMLTFVIDTSGSMAQPDRIGLARLALELLMDQLAAQDRIQLIAYSDHARLVLESVSASEKERVVAAFKRLQCNGSTNLEEGLQQAYAQAVQSFVPGAENRVILISDGVANLGADSAQEILNKVAASRKQGITCSVFGVGRGTYNDRMLEELANKGDGVYKFLDSAEEVKRAFVDDLAATLNTIAKDAKIQVEWNPAVVRRYRQLGYENRALTKEQFRDDTVDAGEVGSGQSVTALYELELAPDVNRESRLGTVRVRYQRTDNGRIEEIETPLLAASVLSPAHKATPSFKVAASAAEFAEQLRGSPYAAGARFQSIADYLRPAALELSLDTRVKELLDLITAMEAMQ